MNDYATASIALGARVLSDGLACGGNLRCRQLREKQVDFQLRKKGTPQFLDRLPCRCCVDTLPRREHAAICVIQIVDRARDAALM